jgi:hypothetical protein
VATERKMGKVLQLVEPPAVAVHQNGQKEPVMA